MATVKKKVSKGLSKVSKRADMIGAVLGYFSTISTVLGYWGEDFIPGTINMHVNAVTKHNTKRLAEGFVEDMKNHSTVILGATVSIFGWVGSMLPSIIPNQGTISSIAKKVGYGLIVGGAVATAVQLLAQGSNPGSGVGGNRSGAVWQVPQQTTRAVSTAGEVFPIHVTTGYARPIQ